MEICSSPWYLWWNQTWWRICSWHCRYQKCILVSRKKIPVPTLLKLELLLGSWGLHLPCVLSLCVGTVEEVVVLVEQKGPGDQATSCAGAVYLLRLFPSESIYYQRPLFQSDWLRLSEDFSVTLLRVEINLQRRIYNGQLWLNRSSLSHISEGQLMSFG